MYPSTEFFTYYKPDNSLVAEASDLCGQVHDERLWDDACDVGIRLRSHKTGKVMTFVKTEPETDRDGEVLSWNYISVEEDVNGRKVKVVIFND